MTKQELVGKLDSMLDEMARQRAYGTIELEVRDGAPILIRKTTTEKVESRGDNTHATRTYR